MHRFTMHLDRLAAEQREAKDQLAALNERLAANPDDEEAAREAVVVSRRLAGFDAEEEEIRQILRRERRAR